LRVECLRIGFVGIVVRILVVRVLVVASRGLRVLGILRVVAIGRVSLAALGEFLADRPFDGFLDRLTHGFLNGFADRFLDGFLDRFPDRLSNFFFDGLVHRLLDRLFDCLHPPFPQRFR